MESKNRSSVSNISWEYLIRKLYPYPSVKIVFQQIDDHITLLFKSLRKTASCPGCGKISHKIHSHYIRRLQDNPIAAIRVKINCIIRKFKCKNNRCDRIIFSEHIQGVTERYSRFSQSAMSQIKKVVVEMSANKGSYIWDSFGYSISSSTCLRILRALTIVIFTDYKVV